MTAPKAPSTTLTPFTSASKIPVSPRSNLQPPRQQIIALLRLDVRPGRPDRDMRHDVDAGPLRILGIGRREQTHDEGHDAVVPDETLETNARSLSLLRVCLRLCGLLCMLGSIDVGVPRLRVLFLRAAVDERDVEGWLDAARIQELVV